MHGDRIGSRKPTDLDYGAGEVTIDCDRLGLIDEDELTGRLVRTFEAPGYRPPRLPTIATELLSLSRKPDVDFHDLEKVLEQDSTLAGEVLSLSRSAFYSGVRPVSGLHEALVRLGLTKLQQVVMQAAVNMRVFRSKAYAASMERLRRHSRSCAHVARIVSRYTPIDEEQAFLCGLLHDVGIAGILLVLGDAQRGADAPDVSVLWPAIHSAHPRAGGRMVEHWRLVADISLAVSLHHQVTVDGHDHPVAATICLAEALTAEIGAQFAPQDAAAAPPGARAADNPHSRDNIDRSDAQTIQRAREALELDDRVLGLVRRDVREWALADRRGEGAAG